MILVLLGRLVLHDAYWILSCLHELLGSVLLLHNGCRLDTLRGPFWETRSFPAVRPAAGLCDMDCPYRWGTGSPWWLTQQRLISITVLFIDNYSRLWFVLCGGGYVGGFYVGVTGGCLVGLVYIACIFDTVYID